MQGGQSRQSRTAEANGHAAGFPVGYRSFHPGDRTPGGRGRETVLLHGGFAWLDFQTAGVS